ncbi:hypothetical protein GEMRC1_001480 [Eukaryota sp. GEM-RC1]
MSTDNNNYCVPCGSAPCDAQLPHSPGSQDPTLSRLVIESSVPPLTPQNFSEVVGSVPTPQTQQTSPVGSALQRIPVIEGSALSSQPQEEVITNREDSPPEGTALQSSTSLEDPVLQINNQDLTHPRTFSKDTHPPTSPSFERIRAMFSGAPTPNKPFPTLSLSSSATPMSQSGRV